MNNKKLLYPVLLSAAGLALTTFRRSASPVKLYPGPKQEPYAEIDAFIADQLRRLNIPGAALAIVEGDKVVHTCGFGRARPGGEVPSPQTPFFIGSLTKSFTALAIMQLVEAGKVALDAPIQRYLPWFRVADSRASAQMSVRHLLNQTSGLPVSLGLAGLADLDRLPDALERQVRQLSTLTLSRPVGAKFEYTNTNYNILGLIIEYTSGETYADYVQKHILEPLDMRRTFTSKAAAQSAGLAVGHRFWFGYPIPCPDLSIPAGSLPSGQLISTAEDMAHYLVAQLNGGRYCGAHILSEAGIEEMHHPAAEINEMGMSLGHYAMGWIYEKSGTEPIIWHSGIVPDFGAVMALLPGQNKGLVLLFNANHAMLKLTLDELGVAAAVRLAGERSKPSLLSAAPWLMRGMLLIPVLQAAGVSAVLQRLSRWRANPALRPLRRRLWLQHILLPLVPDLLAILSLAPMLGKLRGFIRFFMPDYAWMASLCGSFAAVWAIVRTVLVLCEFHRPDRSPTRRQAVPKLFMINSAGDKPK